jgi:hypothetical protein
MNKPRKFRQIRERYFSAHHMLLRNAQHEFELAKAKGRGWHDQAVVSITLCALSVEAMANAFGKRVIPEWEVFESSSPLAKLFLIADKLGIDHDLRAAPWREVKWLCTYRNEIAHPKAEPVVEPKLIDEHKLNDREIAPPFSKLERKITVPQAGHSLVAVRALQDLLCSKLSPEDQFGLSWDSWMGTTQLIQPK